MKIAEIRELSTVELNEKVYELKQELLALRFQHATGQLENGNKIAESRRRRHARNNIDNRRRRTFRQYRKRT